MRTHQHLEESVEAIESTSVPFHLSELSLERLLDGRCELSERQVDERLDELGEESDLALVRLREKLSCTEVGILLLQDINDVQYLLPESLQIET